MQGVDNRCAGLTPTWRRTIDRSRSSISVETVVEISASADTLSMKWNCNTCPLKTWVSGTLSHSHWRLVNDVTGLYSTNVQGPVYEAPAVVVRSPRSASGILASIPGRDLRKHCGHVRTRFHICAWSSPTSAKNRSSVRAQPEPYVGKASPKPLDGSTSAHVAQQKFLWARLLIQAMCCDRSIEGPSCRGSATAAI